MASPLKHQNSEMNQLDKLPNKVVLDLNKSMDSIKGVARTSSIVTQLLMPGTAPRSKEDGKLEQAKDQPNTKASRLSNQNILNTTDNNNSHDLHTEGSDEMTFVKQEAQESSQNYSMEDPSQLKNNLDSKMQDYLSRMDPLDQEDKQGTTDLAQL